MEFIDRVDEKYQIFLLGADSDIPLCESIKEKSINKNITVLSGKLTMLESAALMESAVMNFVNDSSPLHLASSVNAPVTAIFCSTVTSFGFGPLSDDSVVIECEDKLPCRPCGLHGHKDCPERHFSCAENISVDLLLKRIK